MTNEIELCVKGKGKGRMVSFPSFAIGCIENNLFTSAAQQDFLHIKDNSECLERVKEFIKNDTLKLVGERFKCVGQFDTYYKNWICPLETGLAKDYSSSAHILLIRLKLVESESLSVYIEYFLPLLLYNRSRTKGILGPFNAFTDPLNILI